MDIRVSDDPARAAALFIADRLRLAISDRGSASLAVSGGSTGPRLLSALSDALGPEVSSRVLVWQVDERVAPDGDPYRNAEQLTGTGFRTQLMPVTGPDVEAAADSYASTLPEPFDVVHLGIGDDGHTASWPPDPHGDAAKVLVSDARVLVVGEFHGRPRMSLGVSVVNQARIRVVLALGGSKATVVRRWFDAANHHGQSALDTSLPVAAVEPAGTVVFLDVDAAGDLDPGDVTEVDDSARDGYGRPG